MNTTATITLGLTAVLALGAASCTDRRSAALASPKPYPSALCPISGEKLGSMGESITVIKDGYEVKFCCQECVDKFTKHPTQVMDKVKTAVEPEFMHGS